ncbi:tetratricopeptide repeat protein [Poriferisphaera sp. WC338]|uniref:tetratricopeptide repeat protein n=1 Tax=Poriferisphaera sp. WC338 TaxID=3425129 RepID=UPI003D81A12A
MAGRVNTKFVFVLSSVIIFLVATLAGLWYVFVRNSPEQLVRQGDALMAEGNPYIAIKKYAGAVQSEANNLNYIDKYLSALVELKAEDAVEAQQYIGQKISWQKKAADLVPTDLTYRETYYTTLLEYRKKLGYASFADKIAEHADNLLLSYPSDLNLLKNRGLARILMMNNNMSPEDRAMGYHDLLLVAEENPDDLEAKFYLARYHLAEANLLDRPSGDRELAIEHRNHVLSIAEDLIASPTQTIKNQINTVSILLDSSMNANLPVTASEEQVQAVKDAANARLEIAKPIIIALEEKVLTKSNVDDDDLRTVAGFVQYANREIVKREDSTQTTVGIERAKALFKHGLKKDPTNAFFMFYLGSNHLQSNDVDDALKLFRQTMDVTGADTPIRLLRNRNLQVQAGMHAGNILVQQANASKDVEQKAEKHAEIEKILARMEKDNINAAVIDALRSKLLVSQGNFRDAEASIESAIAGLGNIDPSLQLLAVESRLKKGEWGAAASMLEEYLKRSPNDARQRLKLAQLYLKHKQIEQARTHVDELKRLIPDNNGTKALEGIILAADKKTDEALEIFENMDVNAFPQIHQTLAGLYMAKGEQEKAKEHAIQYFETDPTNIRALQMVLGFTKDQQEQESLIAIAKESGADASTLDVLSKRVRGEEININADELIAQMSDKIEDPFTKQLARVRLYAQAGDRENLATAIAEAAKLQPENPDVVRLQFNLEVDEQSKLPISERDWTKAETIVAFAAEKNIDKAQGELYRARLAAAQGKNELAAVSYRRALSAVEINSDGWFELGQVLLRDLKFDESKQAFLKALSQRPDHIRAMQGLSQVLIQLGQGEEALGYITKARSYAPNDLILLNQYLTLEQKYGSRERVIEIRENLANRLPQNYGNKRMLALIYAEDGKYDEAIKLMKQVTKDEGDSRTNINALAQIHAVSGDVTAGRTLIEQYLVGLIDTVAAEDYLMFGRYLIRHDQSRTDIENAYSNAIELEDTEAMPASRELADLYFSRRLYAEAAAIYQSIFDKSNADTRVGLRLSETYINISEFDKASTVLSKLDPTDKRVAESLVLRALIAENNKNTTEALQLINKAIRADRNNAKLYYQRARVLRINPNSLNDAFKDLNRAIELDPNMLIARRDIAILNLQMGNRDDAIRELNNLVGKHPEYIPARLELVRLYSQKQEITALKVLLDDSEQTFPEDARWPNLKAELALRNGNRDSAIASYLKVLELQPNAPTLNALAQQYVLNDQPAQALEIIDKHPSLAVTPVIKAIKGHALIKTDETEDGSHLLSEALNESNDYVQMSAIGAQIRLALGIDTFRTMLGSLTNAEQVTWANLLLAESALRSRDYQATIDFVRLVEADLKDDMKVRGLQLLSNALYGAKDFTASKEVYYQLIELRPNDLGTLNNLAYLLAAKLNDPTPAVPLAKRALELAPKNPQVMDTYGWILYLTGEYDHAKDILEECIQIQPIAPGMLHLGMVYEKLDLNLGAKDMYERAIEAAKLASDKDVLAEAADRLNTLEQ